MSRSLDGPWTAPVDDAFDGRAYYAARSASDGQHRYLFGWVATKADERDLGAWQWGGTLVVHEVYQRPDGSLGVAMPSTVRSAFADPRPLAPATLSSPDGAAEVVLGTTAGACFLFAARVRFAAGTRSFALRLFEDDETGEAYAFTFLVGENRVVFDKRPYDPRECYDNRGLERPLPLEADREYEVRLVVDGTIATLYVDGVALNVRMYEKPGQSIVADVVNGTLNLLEASLSPLRRTDESIVAAFNAAINRRDLAGLERLMAPAHTFIDSEANAVLGKPACFDAWRGFFESFPDYRNVFDTVQSAEPGIVDVTGRSECSEPALAGPARWRVQLADGLVTEWRVYDVDTS